jgi:hypothetical protein
MHLKGISLRCISFCIKLVYVECVGSVLDYGNEINNPGNIAYKGNYTKNTNYESRSCFCFCEANDSENKTEDSTNKDLKKKLYDERKIGKEFCV